jgi:hypothetical protein
MASAEQAREERLRAAGLIPIGTVDEVGGVTPAAAWDLVVRGNDPVVVVDEDEDLDVVNTAWLRLTRERGFFADDGSFLISTTGATESVLPWARVRLGDQPRLAQVLVAYPGEPEFVAMSAGATAVSGVTTEEHGFWIMWRDLPPAAT